MSASELSKQYVGPIAALVVVLAVWSLLVAPWITEMHADLAFLRAARIQAIQQMQQQRTPPATAADTK